MAALGAALVFGVVASTEGPLPTVATNLAYPLGDLALLAFVIARHHGRRPRGRAGRGGSSRAGFGVFAIADTIYLYEVAIDGYRENTHPRRRLAGGVPAPRVRGVAARAAPDARRLRGAGMLGPAHGGGRRRDQHPRRRPLRAPERPRGVARIGRARRHRRPLRPHLQGEPPHAAGERGGGDDRRADRAREPACAPSDLETRGRRDAERATCSRCSTSTASSPTTTRSATPPATRCSSASGATSTPRSATRAAPTGWAATSSASSRPPGTATRRSSWTPRTRSPSGAGASTSAARTAWSVLDARGGDAVEALQTADQRLYENKRSRRPAGESVHRGAHGRRRRARRRAAPPRRRRRRAGRARRPRDGAGRADLVHVRRAAALHDIGKIAIPDDILHAPRPLTEDEWQYMRQHTVIGERIISAAPELAHVAEIVRSSHERWDGGGYPDGLAAERHPARRADRRGLRLVGGDDLLARLPRGDAADAGHARARRAARAPSSTRASSRPSSPCVRRPPTTTTPGRRRPRRPRPRSRRSAPAPPGRRSRRRP